MVPSLRGVVLLFAVSASACGSSARTARVDVVIQWNQQVMATGGPQIQRTLAMTHLAMFDAANAIDRRFTSFATVPAPPAGASVEAAAAAAAYGVLVRLFPAEERTLRAALARSLSDTPDGVAEDAGVAFGDLVAKAVVEARLGDNILAPDPPAVFGSAPGDYRPTDPEPSKLLNMGASRWKPFALESASQFRPGPPPALTSERYARDVEEVRRLGGMTSTRTDDQQQIARWHTEEGVRQINRIARTETAADERSLVEHAQLFAVLNVALADATMSVFDAKYAYLFWRPITAIRHADEDSNPNTHQDLVWSPFLPTPAHPEYPSAHAAVHSAGARVLTMYFGRFHPFATTSSAVPGVTRSYKSFDAFVEEGEIARILGGMHFRSSVEQGAELGEQVGNWVIEHCLLPLKTP
jgi:hypothetical protein